MSAICRWDRPSLMSATMLALIGGPESVEFGWIRVAGGNALAAVTMATLFYVRKLEIQPVAKGEVE